MTSQQLLELCHTTLEGHYPVSMQAIETQVAGPGFFPGTSGFFHTDSLSEHVRKPFMFVGQDFGTLNYLKELENDPQADMKVGTGLILKKLVQESGLNIQDCFLTNALFGIRVSDNITGTCEGWLDKNYVEKCRQALALQIEAVQPKAIISLGCDAPRLLRLLFEEIEVSKWHQWTFKKIDSSGASVLEIKGHASVVVSCILVHPSFHHVNVRRRTFGQVEGHQAEIEMLKEIKHRIAV